MAPLNGTRATLNGTQKPKTEKKTQKTATTKKTINKKTFFVYIGSCIYTFFVFVVVVGFGVPFRVARVPFSGALTSVQPTCTPCKYQKDPNFK